MEWIDIVRPALAGSASVMPSWLAISLVTAPCGFLFGLTLASDGEKRCGTSGFMLFGDRTWIRLIASAMVNAALVSILYIVPSGLLLDVFGLVPLGGNDRYTWAVSLLDGAAIGKTLRWLRWRRRQDFF